MTKHGTSPKMLDNPREERGEFRVAWVAGKKQAQGPCTITFVVMPCLSTDGRSTEDTDGSNRTAAVPREKLWKPMRGPWISSGIMTAILFGFQLWNCSPLSIPSSPYPLFMGRDITTSHVQPDAVWPHALGMLGILAMFLTFFYCHLQWGRAKNSDRMSLFFVPISWKICPCTLQFSCWLCLVLAITMCISVYLAEIWGINMYQHIPW